MTIDRILKHLVSCRRERNGLSATERWVGQEAVGLNYRGGDAGCTLLSLPLKNSAHPPWHNLLWEDEASITSAA